MSADERYDKVLDDYTLSEMKLRDQPSLLLGLFSGGVVDWTRRERDKLVRAGWLEPLKTGYNHRIRYELTSSATDAWNEYERYAIDRLTKEAEEIRSDVTYLATLKLQIWNKRYHKRGTHHETMTERLGRLTAPAYEALAETLLRGSVDFEVHNPGHAELESLGMGRRVVTASGSVFILTAETIARVHLAAIEASNRQRRAAEVLFARRRARQGLERTVWLDLVPPKIARAQIAWERRALAKRMKDVGVGVEVATRRLCVSPSTFNKWVGLALRQTESPVERYLGSRIDIDRLRLMLSTTEPKER